tara:strand:+ start:356 stop:580 length:225 start_codon:yes stop_codon:yes gene_type:complete
MGVLKTLSFGPKFFLKTNLLFCFITICPVKSLGIKIDMESLFKVFDLDRIGREKNSKQIIFAILFYAQAFFFGF